MGWGALGWEWVLYGLEESFCAGNDESGGASAMKHHSLPIKMTLPFPGFHRGLGTVLDSTCITPQNSARRALQNHFTEGKPRPKATRASDEQGGGSGPIALIVSAAASCRDLGTLEPGLSLASLRPRPPHEGRSFPAAGVCSP